MREVTVKNELYLRGPGLPEAAVAHAEAVFCREAGLGGIDMPESTRRAVRAAVGLAAQYVRQEMMALQYQAPCGRTLRVSRYGFHAMQAGESYWIELPPEDLPYLRSAAVIYGKDHGMRFKVNKLPKGAKITRVE